MASIWQCSQTLLILSRVVWPTDQQIKLRRLGAITRRGSGGTDGREVGALLTRVTWGPDHATACGAGELSGELCSEFLVNLTFDLGQGCRWGFTAQCFRRRKPGPPFDDSAKEIMLQPRTACLRLWLLGQGSPTVLSGHKVLSGYTLGLGLVGGTSRKTKCVHPNHLFILSSASVMKVSQAAMGSKRGPEFSPTLCDFGPIVLHLGLCLLVFGKRI